MYASSTFVTTLAVVVVLLSPSFVTGGGVCTCSKGRRTFSAPPRSGKIFRTAAAACSNAGSKCFKDKCRNGMTCKRRPACGFKKAFPVRIRDSFGRRYSCGVTCTGRQTKCKPKPGGKGDPHLTGFDGSRFDFHGEHGKYYTMFGRSDGDMLITRMRSTHRISPKTGIEKTYFDEFGLKIGNSPHRVAVALVKGDKAGSEWFSEVTVDGAKIDGSMDLDGARVIMDEARDTIRIITAETKYTFRPKDLSEQASNRHLNLALELSGAPQKSDKYVGVLGFTLNKQIGHEVHPDLNVATREETELEFSLRNRCEVDSLFPTHSTESLSMDGVVRMSVDEDVPDMRVVLRAEVNSLEA